MDEIEHLENIDTRILREIEQSDLMLADLTYARPSVYFEAGFAERTGIPVIYSCRTDHLSPASRTAQRVHFDVRQRPILDWHDEYDDSFTRRLEVRIRSVAGLLKDNPRVSARPEVEEFERLTPEVRCQELLRLAVRIAIQARFRPAPVLIRSSTSMRWMGSWDMHRTIYRLLVMPAPSHTMADLRVLHREWVAQDLFAGTVPSWRTSGNAFVHLEDHVFLASLTELPVDRVEAIFDTFERRGERRWMVWRENKFSIVRRLHVIDGVRSRRQFKTIFDTAVRRIGQ